MSATPRKLGLVVLLLFSRNSAALKSANLINFPMFSIRDKKKKNDRTRVALLPVIW